MTRAPRRLSPSWFALLMAFAFALILAPLYAHGQDFAVAPGVIDPWFALAAQFVGPSMAVFGVVLVARLTYPPWFDPTPRTERAKLLCMAVALLAGAVLGLVNVAPAVGQPGLAGRLVGGFLCACLATFGRDFFVRARDGFLVRAPPEKPILMPPAGP